MQSRGRIFSCLFALIVLAGCASTKVTNRQTLVNEQIPRPKRILVYYFGITAADVPADSALAGQVAEPSTPRTDEEMKAGRELGAQLAIKLAADIKAMGLPAFAVTRLISPQGGDLVIKGYLVSVDEGSAVKRVVIGFGAGASELRTVVEGYQMTDQGLRKLGSATVDSRGSLSPGAVLGVAGLVAKVYGETSGGSTIAARAEATAQEIADQLKPRFEQQGWIK